MRAKWVIENFTDSEDYRDLISAVRESGRECFVIGRNNHYDFDPKGYNENDCVIVQGSIQMTKNIRSRLPKGCFPVAYNSFENYLCSAYYPAFKEFLFNDQHEFTTVQELQARKFDFYAKYGREAMIFIRPDSGEKTFAGQLLDLQDFDRFWNNAVACSATATDVVIVSTPKNIRGEYRFVCTRHFGGRIIAGSTYVYQGQKTLIPSCPPLAEALCCKILDRGLDVGLPDSVFCIDVAEDNDGHFWLLELTSFSSAGLYATNKKSVVRAVSEIAEFEWTNKYAATT